MARGRMQAGRCCGSLRRSGEGRRRGHFYFAGAGERTFLRCCRVDSRVHAVPRLTLEKHALASCAGLSTFIRRTAWTRESTLQLRWQAHAFRVSVGAPRGYKYPPYEGRCCSSICAFRQAGHQHAVSAATPVPLAGTAAVATFGTGTTGGNCVHQHGPSPPSAMAQPKAAPQRLQRLIALPRDRVPVSCVISSKHSSAAILGGSHNKIQQDRHIMPAGVGVLPVKSPPLLFRTLHERSVDQPEDRGPIE